MHAAIIGGTAVPLLGQTMRAAIIGGTAVPLLGQTMPAIYMRCDR